jgi:hypothetical protein
MMQAVLAPSVCEVLSLLPIAVPVLAGHYIHLMVEGRRNCYSRKTVHGQDLLNTEAATYEHWHSM